MTYRARGGPFRAAAGGAVIAVGDGRCEIALIQLFLNVIERARGDLEHALIARYGQKRIAGEPILQQSRGRDGLGARNHEHPDLFALGLCNAARAMFKDLWEHRLVGGAKRIKTLKVEPKKVNQQVEQFLDRIANASILRSSLPMRLALRHWKIARSFWRRTSPKPGVRCAASTRHLEPLSTSSQVLGKYGLPSVWTTSARSSSRLLLAGWPMRGMRDLAPPLFPCRSSS
ncbi:hypothetical protein LMG29542_07315 [Paraburkholderia humisilvae]|uniref:Uncharacterized protein n=1 Tax=Paraburkholderia humisilvae TaxID=627669 RepID=A0A6J5F702_9BURK|nr:hypothetical protein LMG29542_07315 [Paraburkholderia humisilvae]